MKNAQNAFRFYFSGYKKSRTGLSGIKREIAKKFWMKIHPELFGGRGWIRTTEVTDNRFTVCPLWPLGNSPLLNWKFSGAGGRTWTPDLLITNQLLYQLSYTSILVVRQLVYYIKQIVSCQYPTLNFYGRGDRTWTCGILVPNQALYQTELRLDEHRHYYIASFLFCQHLFSKKSKFFIFPLFSPEFLLPRLTSTRCVPARFWLKIRLFCAFFLTSYLKLFIIRQYKGFVLFFKKWKG